MVDATSEPGRRTPLHSRHNLGKHIASKWPPGSLVALNTAGSTPFYARDLRFVDMLGLNDAHIARRPITVIQLPWPDGPRTPEGDGEYVLRRRPDYIILVLRRELRSESLCFSPTWRLGETPLFLRLCPPREHLDVTDLKRFELYDATRTGMLTFTYYERRRDRESEADAQGD